MIGENLMYLAENKWGLALIDFIKISEEEMLDNKEYKPITGSLILVKCKNKYLIAFNKWRKQWELPAGGIEQGETPRQGAVRELYEETSQKADDICFKGLFKIYDKSRDIIKYQAIYCGCIEKLDAFAENVEMKEIMLWDLKTEIGVFDEVDIKMIELSLQ